MRDLKAVVTPDTSVPDASPFLRMWAVTRMTGLGRSTIYRLIDKTNFHHRCAWQTGRLRGAERISNDGVKRVRPSLTDAASAAPATYAGSISFITKPMSTRAPATQPQRQVVNR